MRNIRVPAVLIVLFVCLFSPILLFSQEKVIAEDWYYGKPIKSINFEGLKNIHRTELDGITTPFIGKEFSDTIYYDLLEKLYALEFFNDIIPVAAPFDANYNAVLLKFTVTEKPIILSIQFTGNNGVRSGEMLDTITVKQGDIYNEIKSRLDERAIRDLYLAKGYTNIKVSSEKIQDETGVKLIFTIDEGSQTIISKINFEGNKLVASNTLKGQLSLKEASLFNKGAFKEATLEADKAAILRYYWDRGYIDARITDVIRAADTSDGKNNLTLTFIITEGPQYVYGGTVFEGNTLFSSETLTEKIRLSEGEVFNYTKYENGLMAAADVYYENGYTSNQIMRTENRDTATRTISFIVSIVERPRSHIENIIITGNNKTKDFVIYRELPIQTGDVFSKAKLMSGLRNLYNLQYFSQIVPDITQGSETNLVDIVIALEEQSTTSIEFGITFSGSTNADSLPISVFGKWQDSNLLGLGQVISAGLTFATDTQNINLGYSYKWFMGLPLTLNFNFNVAHNSLTTAQHTFYPIENSTQTLMNYDQWVIGAGVSTGYRWVPDFAITTLTGGISVNLVQNFYDPVLFQPLDSVISKNYGKWNWNNSIWTALSLDDRDINYDPSSGWFFKQGLSLTGLLPSPIENEYYIRTDTKGELYFTLLDIPVTDIWNLKFVLAGYSGLSLIFPLEEIGSRNMLYIDGMFNGRGWIGAGVTGNAQWSNWIELRMPVAPGILSIDFFLDAIATKEGAADMFTQLSLNDFYFSFGPSLRFSIAQFPLRLLLANTFKVNDGQVQWGVDGKDSGPQWRFVLSFNLTNL